MNTPAGWILDPFDSSVERWWDGEKFTEQTRPSYVGPKAPEKKDSTNVLAIVAFILSFLISFVGVILGHISRTQIRRDGSKGDGLAIAALVIGYIQIGVVSIFTIITVLVIGSFDPP